VPLDEDEAYKKKVLMKERWDKEEGDVPCPKSISDKTEYFPNQ
jgi:hypothetical protein